MNKKRRLQLKKAILLVSFVAVLVLLGIFTYIFVNQFTEIRNAESLKEFILSFGAKSVLIGFLLQCLQVFVAFVPGEIVEIGLGYAFGAIGGTIICYAGLCASSSLVFLFCKKLGVKFVELFFSRAKIDTLNFVKNTIHNKAKLQKLVFIIFLIPGTPKDLLTYFVGLTPMSLSEFLCITMIARIPTVLSSTVGGSLVQNGKYIAAAILFAVTALLSIAGWFAYQKISYNREVKK